MSEFLGAGTYRVDRANLFVNADVSISNLALGTGHLEIAPDATLTIISTYQQPSGGTLVVLAAADYRFGHLNIGGQAMLDGTLRTTFVGGFSPSVGNQFTVVDYASVVGQFATNDGGNVTLETTYGPTSLTLTVTDVGAAVNNVVGDADGDGDDFLAWQSGFGTTSGATIGDGDFNNDSDVDGDDFLVWQAAFQPDTSGGAAASTALASSRPFQAFGQVHRSSSSKLPAASLADRVFADWTRHSLHPLEDINIWEAS